MQTPNGYFGARLDTFDERDWRLGGDIILPTPIHSYWKSEIQYDQREVHPYSCTIHGSIGAMSDLTGYEFSLEERKLIWEKAKERGASEQWGWYTRNAVQLMKEMGQEILGEKFDYFFAPLGSHDFFYALEKGYTAVVSIRGNSAYVNDYLDGTLDETEFGEWTWGHCLRITESKDDPESLTLIVDNYKDHKSRPNTYKIPKDNLKDLVAGGVFFQNGYIFTSQKDFDAMNEPDIPLWATEAVAWAVENKIATVWTADEMERRVGDEAMEKMMIRMNLLSQEVGYVSKIRWIVAMHRAYEKGIII